MFLESVACWHGTHPGCDGHARDWLNNRSGPCTCTCHTKETP